MRRSLDSKLKASIQSACYSDQLVEELEVLFTQDREDALALLKAFQMRKFDLETQENTLTLFKYLMRFVSIFGHESVQPWYMLLVQHFDSQHSSLTAVLVPLIVELMKRDEDWCKLIFEADFIANFSLLAPRRSVISFGNSRAEEYFTRASPYLHSPESSRQSYGLVLLAEIAQSECPNLDSITSTQAWSGLISFLENSDDITNILSATRSFLMLLQYALNHLCNIEFLQRIFRIFSRLLCWPRKRLERDDLEGTSPNSGPLPRETPSEKELLHDTILHLFLHLYGLFPHNFIAYARATMISDPDFHDAFKPIITSAHVHSKLLESSIEEELDPNRWKGRDFQTELADVICEKEPTPFIPSSSDIANSIVSDSDDIVAFGTSPANAAYSTQTLLVRFSDLVLLLFTGQMQLSRNEREPNSRGDKLSTELRTRLLFEQHAKGMYIQRLNILRKERSTHRRLLNRLQELEEDSNSVHEFNEKLLCENEENLKRIKSLNSELSTLRENARVSAQMLALRERLLKDEAAKAFSDENQLNVSGLVTQTNGQASTIFTQQAEIDTLKRRIKDYEEMQTARLSLQDELVMGLEAHHLKIESLQLIKELQLQVIRLENDLARAKGDLFGQYTSFSSLVAENVSYQQRLEALEFALSQEQARHVQLKEILKSAHSQSSAQLTHLQDKYETTKKINLGLERELLTYRAYEAARDSLPPDSAINSHQEIVKSSDIQ